MIRARLKDDKQEAVISLSRDKDDIDINIEINGKKLLLAFFNKDGELILVYQNREDVVLLLDIGFSIDGTNYIKIGDK